MIGDHEYDVVSGGTPPGAGSSSISTTSSHLRADRGRSGEGLLQLRPRGLARRRSERGVLFPGRSQLRHGAPGAVVRKRPEREDRDCTVVMWHAARFSSGSIHGNYMPTQQFWATSYEHGVELVLSGNEHIYERFARMDAAGNFDPQYGVRPFVVGTGGYSHYDFATIKPNSQARNNDTYGVLKLTLRASDFDWQFVPEAGRTFTDSGTDTCHPHRRPRRPARPRFGPPPRAARIILRRRSRSQSRPGPSRATCCSGSWPISPGGHESQSSRRLDCSSEHRSQRRQQCPGSTPGTRSPGPPSPPRTRSHSPARVRPSEVESSRSLEQARRRSMLRPARCPRRTRSS